MTKKRDLDDAKLGGVTGAGDTAPTEKPGPPQKRPPGGTHLDDPDQQPDVGGGLTDPNLG